MNLVKTLTLSVVLIVVSLSASVTNSQTLYGSRQKLEKLNIEMGQLDARNQTISAELKTLDKQIVDMKKSLGSDPEIVAVEELLAAAKLAAEQEPSKLNKDRLEMAEFKHALMARKQAKSTPELTRLLESSESLQKELASNEATMTKLEGQLATQLQQIERLEIEAKEAERLAAIRKRQEETNALAKLKQAESEKQDALAEIERLKRQLAEQEAQSPAAAVVTAATPPSPASPQKAPNNAVTSAPSGATYFATSAELNQFLASSPAMPKTTDEARNFAKFLVVKSLVNVDTKIKPIKLKPEAPGLYINDDVDLAKEALKFIVGLDSWQLDLSVLDNTNKKATVGNYSVYLVVRGETNQILIAPN